SCSSCLMSMAKSWSARPTSASTIRSRRSAPTKRPTTCSTSSAVFCPASKSINRRLCSNSAVSGRSPTATRDIPAMSAATIKLRSCRAFDEQAADLALKRLGIARKVSTSERKFGGGKDYPREPDAYVSEIAEDFKIKLPRVEALFERYGTRALYITNYIVDTGD